MKYVAAIVVIVLLSSCVNDMGQIMGLADDKSPDMTSYDFQMIYSDSGVVKARLTAPQRDVYEGENGYMELPKGLSVVFYDAYKKPETTINAKYGIRKEKEGTMEVRNNVVVVNAKKEQLKTERLIWDEETQKLHTDANVTITTADEVLLGKGLEADQNFSSYRILQPMGSFKLKDSPVE